MVWKRVGRAVDPMMRSPVGWRKTASEAENFRMASSCLARRVSHPGFADFGQGYESRGLGAAVVGEKVGARLVAKARNAMAARREQG